MTTRADRWRLMWERLVTLVPKDFHIYLKFKTLSITDEFLDINIPWLNKISLLVYKKTWSHRVIMDMLNRISPKPDLIFIDVLIVAANATSQEVQINLDDWVKKLNKQEEAYVKEEENTKTQILNELQKVMDENKKLAQENKAKSKLIEETIKSDEEEEEEDDEEIDINPTGEKLIQDLGERMFGKFNYHYLILQSNQLNILDQLVENKEIIDLNGLINKQENAEDLLMKQIQTNWKEILNKIKEKQNQITIPSELIDSEFLFYPKEELKSFNSIVRGQQFELVTISNQIRPNSEPKQREREKVPKTFDDWNKLERNQEEEKKRNVEISLFKKRSRNSQEGIQQVTKGALLNWIRNMNYEEIQKEINNGKIRLLNYDKEIQDELNYLIRKEKIHF